MVKKRAPYEYTEREKRVLEWTKTKYVPRGARTEGAGGDAPEERKAAKERFRLPGAKAVVTALLFVASGVLVWAIQASDAAFAEAEAANAEVMEGLRVAAAKAEDEAPEAVDVQAAAASIEDATKAAAEVARLQNAYSAINVYTDVVDGFPVIVGEAETLANKQALAAFFSEEARTGGGLDPSQRWFSKWDKVDGQWVQADPANHQWSEPQVWTVLDDRTTRVVWELKDNDDGDMLAWATADFDASEGTFSNVVLGTTTQGQQHMAPTESVGAFTEEGDE